MRLKTQKCELAPAPSLPAGNQFQFFRVHPEDQVNPPILIESPPVNPT